MTADPTGLDVRAALVLPDSVNPYLRYLGRLDGLESARTLGSCLDRIVVLQAEAQGLDVSDLGARPGLRFPWHLLRYAHTAALREALVARGGAPATVNKHLTALRGVLKEAWRLGLMTGEDYLRARDVENVKGTRAPAGRRVDDAEIHALLTACLADPTPAGDRDAAIIALLKLTGLRRSSIAAARREHYTLTGEGAALTVRAKGDRELLIPLHPTAVLYLNRWLSRTGHARGPLFLPVRRGGYLPPTTEDQPPLSPAAIGRMLDRRSEQARIPDLPGRRRPTPHDFPRTQVGDPLDTGADLATVQALAGHADPATTSRYDRRGQRTRTTAISRLTFPAPDQLTPPDASAPEGSQRQ